MTKAALSEFDTDNFIVEPEIFNPQRTLWKLKLNIKEA
jgi:hypothetical protein